MADIKIKDVNFVYPNGHSALENINLEIKEGENVAIVGQNGAGKTTLVKLLNGLNKPTSGDVLIGDKNTKDYTTAQISRSVGYVFQNPDDQIFHSTVEEEVRFGPAYFKLSKEEEDKRVDYALQLTDMEKYRNVNPFDLPLSTRKFVTIAAVLAMNTDVLIFDEPTAGQDIEGNICLGKILKTLHNENKTVITISHDMEFVAENFDRVVVMANKHIVKEGTPQEIFWDFESLEKAMLKQPYASRVCKELGISGVVTVDEAVKEILKLK